MGTGAAGIYRGRWIVSSGFMALFFDGATPYVGSAMLPSIQQNLGWSRTKLVGVLRWSASSVPASGWSWDPLFSMSGARWGMTLSAAFGSVFLIMVAWVNSAWQYYVIKGPAIGPTTPVVRLLACSLAPPCCLSRLSSRQPRSSRPSPTNGRTNTARYGPRMASQS